MFLKMLILREGTQMDSRKELNGGEKLIIFLLY
jgi:hypothetical protein